jgi:3-oxoacyl-[acyl-carrier protein] reductase
MANLENRVALVTGAGRGIGRALALRLSREGALLVLNDLDEAPLRETMEAVQSFGGIAVGVAGSVTEDDFHARFVGAAIETFGGINIIVNNAGFSIDAPIHESTDADWDLIQSVNLRAPYRILREAAPFIRAAAKREAQSGQAIIRKVVNVSSMSGVRGNAGQAVYSSAKAGLIGLTRTLAKEWGRHKVTVNAIAFGMIATRQTRPPDQGETVLIGERAVRIGTNQVGVEALAAQIPLGRLGTPEEAAGAIYLFCSPDSNYVSGQIIEAGGGLSA